MSRNKKSRKSGATGDVDLIVTRNRSQSDVEGRSRKRIKKRKGLKTGNRQAEGSEQKLHQASQKRDPRLGSKKPIPLIVEKAKKPSKQQRQASAEKELELLENDAQLNILLDRLESGEKLGAGLQQYVDEKLDRIEILMDQLGLLIPEDELADDDILEEEQEPLEVAIAPVVERKRASTDEELLSQFESLNLDEFKEQ
jgi:ribosome assembly protein YihI (activator of Der GTPase)